MDFKVLIFFILGLSLLIGFHEFGHFLAAKIFNVYVYEFSLFMGPKLFQFQVGETKYTLRLFPIGGYCSMAGEEDSQANRNKKELTEENKISNIEDSIIDENKIIEEEKVEKRPELVIPKERTLLGIKNWKKIIIMAAGSLNNILLCFILMVVYYASVNRSIVNIKDNSYFSQYISAETVNINSMTISFYEDSFKDGDSAKTNFQGLVYNDNIDSYFQVNGIYENSYEYMYERYVETRGLDYNLTNKNIYQKFDFGFEDGTSVSFVRQINPKLNESKSAFVDYEKISDLGFESTNSHYNFLTCIALSAKMEVKMAGLVYNALGHLFTKEGISNVSGVIGMYSVAKTYLGYGFNYFILFLATISVNLGIMNLLPFPALDGGKIVLTIIESITKKKVNPKVENIINTVGFIILLALIVAVAIKDILFPITA